MIKLIQRRATESGDSQMKDNRNIDERRIEEDSEFDLLDGDDGPNGLLYHLQRLASHFKGDEESSPLPVKKFKTKKN